MEEQVEKQARVTVKALQERIAALENYAADLAAKLSQHELKHGMLKDAHNQLWQDFQAYKDKGKWTKQDVQELAKLMAEQSRMQGQNPLKKLLNSGQKR